MSVGPGFKELDLYNTLESCFSQTINTDLFIYFDGVSPSDEIIKFLNDNAVVFNVTHSCKGLATGLNYLICQICAIKEYEFVLRIDCGDINVLSRAEKQVKFLRDRLDIDIVGSQAAIHQNSVFQNKTQHPLDHKDIMHSLKWRNPLIHPSVAFRIKLFRDGLRYDEKMMRCQDYKFWIDLVVAGFLFANIDEALIEYHQDENFMKRRSSVISRYEFMARIHAAKKIGNNSYILFSLAVLVYIFRQLPTSWINFVYSLKN
tara:strand:+ start:1525 stop:2304 length:780 start_codon:yes stop_codon:yes gene_type:complete